MSRNRNTMRRRGRFELVTVSILAAVVPLVAAFPAWAGGQFDGTYGNGIQHVALNPNPAHGVKCFVLGLDNTPAPSLLVANNQGTVDYVAVGGAPRHYYGSIKPDGSFTLDNYDTTNTQIVDGGRKITGRISGNGVDYEIIMTGDACRLFANGATKK
jgi:hypothetical protein